MDQRTLIQSEREELKLVSGSYTYLYRYIVDVDKLKRGPNLPVHLHCRPVTCFKFVLNICDCLALQRSHFHYFQDCKDSVPPYNGRISHELKI